MRRLADFATAILRRMVNLTLIHTTCPAPVRSSAAGTIDAQLRKTHPFAVETASSGTKAFNFGTVQANRMKHEFVNAYFDYWNQRRLDERPPERGDLNPDDISALLGDIFILNATFGSNYPFRIAGSRLCSLFGASLPHMAFGDLFKDSSRHDIEDIIEVVTTEALVTVAGVTATMPSGDKVNLELLLMPLRATVHTNASITGLLVPVQPCSGPIGPLELTSHRYAAHARQRLAPRLLRKWEMARGVMVYEGML